MSTITQTDVESTERELLTVDPTVVCVSDLNERRTVTLPADFEESIRTKGVLEPPLVRDCSDAKRKQGYQYEVLAGQRRTLAAQNVGLETMDVVYCDYSDAQSIEASIIENMDEFREEVPPKERARAIHRLKELREVTQRKLAEQLDVSQGTIRRWIELMRDEWSGTSIHATADDKFSIDDVSQSVFGKVRQQTGGGKDGELALSIIVNEELSEKDVYEATNRAELDTPHTFLDQLEMMGAEKRDMENSDPKERTRIVITFTGETVAQLDAAARASDCTDKEYVRGVVEESLSDEYF